MSQEALGPSLANIITFVFITYILRDVFPLDPVQNLFKFRKITLYAITLYAINDMRKVRTDQAIISWNWKVKLKHYITFCAQHHMVTLTSFVIIAIVYNLVPRTSSLSMFRPRRDPGTRFIVYLSEE